MKKENCVYIGPTIRNVISYGEILHGSLDDAYTAKADAIRRFPEIRLLIVSLESLPSARVEVRTPNRALYRYADDLVKRINKIKGKEV